MTEHPTTGQSISTVNRRGLTAWFIVAVMAVVGIAETVPAIRSELHDHSADVLRQWRTSQYVLARVNPYPIALTALEAKYGSNAPQHLRTIRIYSIPRDGPDPNTRKDIGPPEATYPPTSALILAFTIGRLPPMVLQIIWNLLNIVLFVLIGQELIRLQSVPSTKAWSVACLLSLTLLWWPTTYFFFRGQFTLIVLWCVLVAERLGESRNWLSGILYSLALIKPSLALPFLLSPLRQRRWWTLAWTAAIQLVLLISASLLLRASPVALLSKWLSVGRYFMQGMYTAQEIINDFHLVGSIWNTVIPLVVVALGFSLIYRSETSRTLAMLSVIAVVWTYHYPYDFLVLICALAFLCTPLDQPWGWDVWQWSGLLSLILLGIALTDAAVGGETVAWRLVRWGGRLSLIWLFVAVARAKRSNRNLGPEALAADGFSSARLASEV